MCIYRIADLQVQTADIAADRRSAYPVVERFQITFISNISFCKRILRLLDLNLCVAAVQCIQDRILFDIIAFFKRSGQDLAHLHWDDVIFVHGFHPVSYTHLDVYKRQIWGSLPL